MAKRKLDSYKLLAPFAAAIENSEKPVVFLSRKKQRKVVVEATAEPTTQSWLAGSTPWLPLGQKVPTDVGGAPMTFLAQINFAEMPPLEGFPTEGLIQFFCENCDEDGSYGGDETPTTSTNYHRVLYHPNISVPGYRPDHVLVEAKYPSGTGEALDTQPGGIAFTSSRMPITEEDFRLGSVFGDT
jgi:uncharacterized protein YwqG